MLYLLPGKDFNRPDESDMSGLGLHRIDGNITVFSVDKQSQAFRAGIAAGDKIILINDEEATKLGINTVREILKAKPGNNIKMQAIRQGTIKSFTFTLRRRI
jgi:carboxyl-terminal processing protease